LGQEYVLHLQKDKVNQIFLSTGTSQTAFFVEESEDATLLINLNSYLRDGVEEARSRQRSEISWYEYVRPREPQIIELDALRRLYDSPDQH